MPPGLRGFRDLEAREIEADLSRRWRLERGLLAAANLMLDVAGHITAAHFRTYPSTYEETLAELPGREVLAEETYERLRGLGGLRNVVVHEYVEVDVHEVLRWRERILEAGPGIIDEVATWLEGVEG